MFFFGKQLLAIDLGSTNTLISIYKKGIALREPSIIAMKKETSEIIAYGSEATELVGRVSDAYEIVRPIQHGVIQNFEMTKRMLAFFIKKALRSSRINCETVISVPNNITKVERKALIDALREVGIHRAMLVDEIMVSALGLELPIHRPIGRMVLNIGGGVTSAGILSYNALIMTHSEESGGDAITQAIIDRVRDHYNLQISFDTAEKLKLEIGTAKYEASIDQDEIEVKGLSVATGVPSTISVSEKIVAEAIEPIVKQIVRVCKKVLESIQPELASDILTSGIYITGGGALLRRLNEVLMEELGLNVIISNRPFDDVVNGTNKLIPDLRRESKQIERNRR